MERGVEFVEPSPEQFLALLQGDRVVGRRTQLGGSIIPVYSGSAVRQRGFGFLSLLRSIGSTVLPLVKNRVLPALAPVMGEFASGIVSDLHSRSPGGGGGIGFKESLKRRGRTALKRTWENMQHAQQGGGLRKRHRRRRRRTTRKTTRTRSKAVGRCGGRHRSRKRTSTSKRRRGRKQVGGSGTRRRGRKVNPFGFGRRVTKKKSTARKTKRRVKRKPQLVASSFPSRLDVFGGSG